MHNDDQGLDAMQLREFTLTRGKPRPCSGPFVDLMSPEQAKEMKRLHDENEALKQRVAQLEVERSNHIPDSGNMVLRGDYEDLAQRYRHIERSISALHSSHATLLGLVQAYVEACDEADYRALCSAEDALRATLPAQPAEGGE